MTKKGLDKSILQYLKQTFPKPVSTRELSENLQMAWHTADRYCLKLKLQGKVDFFTIGKSTAWFLVNN